MTARRGVLVVLGLVLAVLAGGSAFGYWQSRRVPAAEVSDTSVTGPSLTGPSTAAVTASGVPTPAHVVVVVMENHGLRQVMGNAQAPWLSSLSGASFTNWHGTSRPSQPNYLAMFAGSDKGVSSDNCPLRFTGDNLAAQLLADGKTFVGYSEGLPAVGSSVCRAYPYARKHNPWADFVNLPVSVNRPFTDFPSDYSKLPTVSFVVPGLCHDTHDCSVATGDAWLRAQLSSYATWAMMNNSLLIVTYDEDDDTSANLIPTLFVGPMVKPGSYDARYDHYSLLGTLEAMYALPKLNRASSAPTPTAIWK